MPKILTIAFDSWYLSSLFRNRGIYVYSREILSHLRAVAAHHDVEVRPFTSAGAENDVRTYEPITGFRPVESDFLKSDRGWRYGGGWLATAFLRPDVLFCPSFNTLYLGFPVPIVTTIHDVTPFVMPNFTAPQILRKLRFQLGWAVKRSRRLIAISNSCKQDLMRVFDIAESRISVVHSGFNRVHFNAQAADADVLFQLKQRYKLRTGYIFHHGLMQPRKNIKMLIRAYGNLLSRNPDLEIDLVLAGKLEYRGEELLEEARKLPQLKGKVVFTGALPDAELATLLKGATMAVIPSLYEGFCLPLVESMACGVATICSNSSCLPEISGGVLKYFDPNSIEEMAESMRQVLTDGKLHLQLARDGLARAANFDWTRTAEQTIHVLMSTATEAR